MLNETEASKLSDIEFKIKIIRMLNELTENYKELQRSDKELTANYPSMNKDTGTINKIHIIGIPEGEREEQGIENLFEKVGKTPLT